MRRSLSFALAALSIAPAARPGVATREAWQWQRVIVPNATSPAAEQCVVLDADLFAGAAPGLRDVRLLQDGRELAYAIDESIDDHAGHGTGGGDDRSVYDTVAAARFMGTEPRGSLVPTPSPSRDRVATAFLPARVPVERLRLIVDGATRRESALPSTMHVTVTARPQDHAARPQAQDHAVDEPELVDLQAGPDRMALPVTLGANLQQPAGVTVQVDPAPASLTRVALEMRRRELCYQPLSSSLITLLFGNARALAVHYDYGRHYQPKAAPLLASLGPAHANPAYRAALPSRSALSTRVKLIAAMAMCGIALALTLFPLLRARR